MSKHLPLAQQFKDPEDNNTSLRDARNFLTSLLSEGLQHGEIVMKSFEEIQVGPGGTHTKTTNEIPEGAIKGENAIFLQVGPVEPVSLHVTLNPIGQPIPQKLYNIARMQADHEEMDEDEFAAQYLPGVNLLKLQKTVSDWNKAGDGAGKGRDASFVD